MFEKLYGWMGITSKRYDVELIVSDSTFDIIENGVLIIHASLAEISQVTGFKRDMLTTDLICFEIAIGSENPASIVEVNEEMEGFGAFVKKLEALKGFDLDWRESVVMPPFATQRTLCFKRKD